MIDNPMKYDPSDNIFTRIDEIIEKYKASKEKLEKEKEDMLKRDECIEKCMNGEELEKCDDEDKSKKDENEENEEKDQNTEEGDEYEYEDDIGGTSDTGSESGNTSSWDSLEDRLRRECEEERKSPEISGYSIEQCINEKKRKILLQQINLNPFIDFYNKIMSIMNIEINGKTLSYITAHDCPYFLTYYYENTITFPECSLDLFIEKTYEISNRTLYQCKDESDLKAFGESKENMVFFYTLLFWTTILVEGIKRMDEYDYFDFDQEIIAERIKNNNYPIYSRLLTAFMHAGLVRRSNIKEVQQIAGEGRSDYIMMVITVYDPHANYPTDLTGTQPYVFSDTLINIRKEVLKILPTYNYNKCMLVNDIYGKIMGYSPFAFVGF